VGGFSWPKYREDGRSYQCVNTKERVNYYRDVRKRALKDFGDMTLVRAYARIFHPHNGGLNNPYAGTFVWQGGVPGDQGPENKLLGNWKTTADLMTAAITPKVIDVSETGASVNEPYDGVEQLFFGYDGITTQGAYVGVGDLKSLYESFEIRADTCLCDELFHYNPDGCSGG